MRTPCPNVFAERKSEDRDGVNIAIIGATGSGKTTFINLASSSNLCVGEGLMPCTSIVQTARPFEISGRSVSLIDTPGFDDTKSDVDVLKLLAKFLQVSHEYGKKLGGIIYLHRITDLRTAGISAHNIKIFKNLCGEGTLKNVIIVTNMWGQVPPSVGEARERELATNETLFKPALDKKAHLIRHDNTRESAQAILRLAIQNGSETLRVHLDPIDARSNIDLSVDVERLRVDHALVELAKRHQVELKELEEDFKIAFKHRDEETQQKLGEIRERVEEMYQKHRQTLISLI
ncbi:P-loop containing nucleoside triphosphate hydrolase protein [Collybia nuda]|uniref:P-loop containing nucleoside triphosphate hydrolase protein n=1 Tax=Collybia nuda TaxID=64659 RepID=A0A9P5Y8P6_9AGAR|nr:P-loop containing nucleoside triphosphate hydrolase protein [Collybia nuda]